jgi:hypothetical protein
MKFFLDPSYPYYSQNHFFDSALPYNRDDRLLPAIRLKKFLEEKGHEIATADLLDPGIQEPVVYYSHGIDTNYRKFALNPHIQMFGFMIYEPPVVAPHLYKQLPELTRVFQNVFLLNTKGDGYSLKGVDTSKLRKLYYPVTYSGVREPYWSNQDRLRRVAVINSNHNPYLFAPYRRTLVLPRKELYSERMKCVVELERAAGGGFVDLYGGRWQDWWSPFSMWLPYWRYRQGLMKVYRGFAPSKFETLSIYDFCLCFENMRMDGYISEKIIDCFYAGTIPVYLGAPNIKEYIPAECFVDFSKFRDSAEAYNYLASLSSEEVDLMRAAGRAFLQSDAYARFHDALIRELNDCISA